MAEWRQAQIAKEVFGGDGVLGYGGRKRLAAKHAVSSATITRDLAAIRTRFGRAACALCQTAIDMRVWRDLQRRGWVKLQKLPKGRRADEAGPGDSHPTLARRWLVAELNAESSRLSVPR